jgi:hypothetical protein
VITRGQLVDRYRDRHAPPTPDHDRFGKLAPPDYRRTPSAGIRLSGGLGLPHLRAAQTLDPERGAGAAGASVDHAG